MSFAYTRANESGEPGRHVPTSSAHVGDDHSRRNADQPLRLVRTLLLLATGALHPAGIGREAGDLPPRERMDGRRRSADDEVCAGVERHQPEQGQDDE